MNILGVIPARCMSKGIPKKNIKLLNGKPLIAYTIEAALASKLDRIIVSTDCEEVAEVSIRYGAGILMRAEILAQDTTPTLSVLQDIMSNIDVKYDAVMTLQPTSPFRTTKHINEAIEIFSGDKEADSLVSAVKVPHNFMPEKLMGYDSLYLSGSSEVIRRQDIKTMYARNGAAIYITKFEKLDEYIFGGKIVPYFMKKIDSFDIDDMEDWEIAERLI
jgi:CMP-N,N'-diacetyllegionaminic acid synthase